MKLVNEINSMLEEVDAKTDMKVDDFVSKFLMKTYKLDSYPDGSGVEGKSIRKTFPVRDIKDVDAKKIEDAINGKFKDILKSVSVKKKSPRNQVAQYWVDIKFK